MERLLYPVEEAAFLAGQGRTRFYAQIKDGSIETVKVGRRRLIPRDALVAYVARLREEARSATVLEAS